MPIQPAFKTEHYDQQQNSVLTMEKICETAHGFKMTHSNAIEDISNLDSNLNEDILRP